MSVYGEQNGGFRCTNSEPGMFSHECGKPAQWIGEKPSSFEAGKTFRACFCDLHKTSGSEARRMQTWQRI